MKLLDKYAKLREFNKNLVGVVSHTIEDGKWSCALVPREVSLRDYWRSL